MTTGDRVRRIARMRRIVLWASGHLSPVREELSLEPLGRLQSKEAGSLSSQRPEPVSENVVRARGGAEVRIREERSAPPPYPPHPALLVIGAGRTL
jgi:hypothetical protein